MLQKQDKETKVALIYFGDPLCLLHVTQHQLAATSHLVFKRSACSRSSQNTIGKQPISQSQSISFRKGFTPLGAIQQSAVIYTDSTPSTVMPFLSFRHKHAGTEQAAVPSRQHRNHALPVLPKETCLCCASKDVLRDTLIPKG